ncbi:Nuclease EXOG, mitochondrial [Myotis davidii]|uniref:Nuclease EXOG, mitochondrial n=1 Tax=Myotis davidii TaxID=225400 RepID=L5LGK6_MYODS|nr:Nuclease EXOG, mitochondrial [Myotis davidii]
MAETFYLSNIVPQNFDNNAGYWNRIEMYCRELTERFDDVWIVSGPLTLPQTGSDGKKIVSYQLLDFQEFTLYLSTRKIEGARSVPRLEKIMENLKNAGIEPDDYFMSCYERKLEELKAKEQAGLPEGKPS